MTAVAPRRLPLPLASGAHPDEVHPPPFLLPGIHFLAALFWLACAAAGLVLIAPHLAGGNMFDPRVFAVTHTVTLGVITTAIFGALYQLFPVTMGRALRRLDAAYVTFALLQAGVCLVVTGFWVGSARLLGWGWTAIALATLLLGVNLVSRCLDTRPDRAIGLYVGAGFLALAAALALGLLRIAESLGVGHVDRLAMIASHFHLATFGFASLITVGVGHRMLPMFLLSHGAPRWPFRWCGPLAATGLLLFAAGQFAALEWLVFLAAGLLTLAGLIYLYLVREYFRRRARRVLDPGLAHVAVAHVFLAGGMVLGLYLLLRPGGFAPRLWEGYGVIMLLGWLVILVVGVLYKILPFLTWLHLFGPRMGELQLPTVADLTRPAWGWLSLAGLTGGTLLLAAATGLGWSQAGVVGGYTFAAGAALVLLQVLRVVMMCYVRGSST